MNYNKKRKEKKPLDYVTDVIIFPIFLIALLFGFEKKK